MNRTIIMARIRLVSGMVLMLYVLGHLSNLWLGLWSLDLMDQWRPTVMAPWRSWIGQSLLFGALASHLVLGLISLSERRNLTSMSPGDAAQLALGLAIPPLLISHLLASRGAELLGGFEPSYGWFMVVYWKQAPLNGLRQVLVVSVAWIHGCLGLHTWLRLRTWWPIAAGFIYPVVFLVPILALLGFVNAGTQAITRLDTGDPAWIAGIATASARFTAVLPMLEQIQNSFLLAYGAVLALALAVSLVRSQLRRRMTAIIDYVDGPTVSASLGLSILEASRINDVPHANACAGHARCATCRVKVIAGMSSLSPPAPQEIELLARTGQPSDVRLACQALLIDTGITIRRLVPADEQEEAARDSARGMATAAFPAGNE